MTRVLPFLVAAAVAGACSSDAASESPGAASESASEFPGAASEFPEAAQLPAHAPELFGFGTPASAERVALWDIDVKPDGEGLPPGSGSVEEGRLVYEAQCLQCHGATGTEGPNDRLVSAGEWEQWPPGRTVGGYWPYASTLFDYTRRAMPQTTPGTLPDDDVYAVVAYVLHLNGIVAADAVLDAATLSEIEMPGYGRFVPDDRTGGPVVR